MKTKIIKTGIALTAFLLLGTTLHLAYKDKLKTAFNTDSSRLIAASQSGARGFDIISTQPLRVSTHRQDYLKNVNYNTASKKSGIPVDKLKQIVPKLVSGAGSCFNVGSIKISHMSCKPAGPGPCTGDPKKPGKDLCPCAVSGTQGGSIQAICFNGCCREVSASGPKGALSGFSGAQQGSFGSLMQSLSGMLKGLMSGGSGGVGGGYTPPTSYSQPSITDNINPSVTDDSSTSFDNYAYDSVASDDASNIIDSTNQAETASSPGELNQDSVDTILSEQNTQSDSNSNQEDSTSEEETVNNTQVIVKPVAQINANDEISQLNQQDTFVDYQFQNINHKNSDDPRVAMLRDPNTSKIRSFDQDTITPTKKKEKEKSFWEVFLSWFGL